MSRFITVNIEDETTPVSQEGFGLGLIVDPENNFDYVEVRSIDDIPDEASELAEDMANQYLSQQPNPGVVAMAGQEPGEEDDIGDVLGDIYEENGDWYGLLLASRNQEEIEQADDWIPADKLFITSPIEDDWDALSEYDLESDKTGAFPSEEEQEVDAAIMSRMFATDPGSQTWKWQELSGVRSSGYSSADVSAMTDPEEGEPHMNPVIWEMGVDYTADGANVNGGFLDIQRAIDWLEARLTENIFQLLVSQGKVSFTNTGIAQVTSRMREVFQQAKGRDVLKEYGIYAPDREDVPTNDRANRVLPDVEFEGIIAGAIHEVEVSGVLQV